MTAHPHVEIIPRTHARTRPPDNPDLPAAEWAELERFLREGFATTWLSVPTPNGVHVRPLFAAWTGATFVFASKATAAKSRHLDADGHCSLAIDLGRAHVVVEDTAARLTGAADLARASSARFDVYEWPTTVVGDELDAPYAAPTSGGPPFRVYEVMPARALAFPPTTNSSRPSSRSADDWSTATVGGTSNPARPVEEHTWSSSQDTSPSSPSSATPTSGAA